MEYERWAPAAVKPQSTTIPYLIEHFRQLCKCRGALLGEPFIFSQHFLGNYLQGIFNVNHVGGPHCF